MECNPWPGYGDPMAFHTINGVDLYSETSGAGEPVLLLHGGYCSLESLRAQSDALEVDHEVLAFERPGHGRSADFDGPFSFARGVADTLAWLDAQQRGPVHVVGYSDGAIIGLMLALEHPERVRSLVAISANIDTTAFAFSPEADGVPMLNKLPDADKPDVERELYNRLSPDGPEHGDEVLEKLFALWKSEPRIDPAELARVSAPTLVMSGDRDHIRVDHSLLIAASIPGAQLAIVPGTTHALISERPDLVNALIRDFLS